MCLCVWLCVLLCFVVFCCVLLCFVLFCFVCLFVCLFIYLFAHPAVSRNRTSTREYCQTRQLFSVFVYTFVSLYVSNTVMHVTALLGILGVCTVSSFSVRTVAHLSESVFYVLSCLELRDLRLSEKARAHRIHFTECVFVV